MLDQMSMPVLFVVVFLVLGLAVVGLLVGARLLSARGQHPPDTHSSGEESPEGQP